MAVLWLLSGDPTWDNGVLEVRQHCSFVPAVGAHLEFWIGTRPPIGVAGPIWHVDDLLH